jgi:pimeloyl-ACP methyl ester carboxylesterase
MSRLPNTPVPAQPCYVATRAGPLRLWRAGSGPHLVVLPGLLRSAAVVARTLAQNFPGWALTVIELPGIGGSSRIGPESPEQLASVIDEALSALCVDAAALVAYDLSAPIAMALAARQAARFGLLLLDQSSACEWVRRGVRPPPLETRADGTHLLALWAHIRDLSMLDALDPARVSRRGDGLALPSALDAAVVAAAVEPVRYAALWDCCTVGFEPPSGTSKVVDATRLSEHLDAWALRLPAGILAPASNSEATRARHGPAGLHYEYLQTPAGRVHLRRVGQGSGRSLLLFHSAPGSAQPLEALMLGLATDREVIACDYLGNGDSDKPQGNVDIAALARHALGIVDALQLHSVDLFGTHTGAMVAMEFAIRWPERVGRMVLEAPVLIDPSFVADILEHYLPPLLPDRWGTHLLRAWNMRRDMFLFWPWYRQSRDSARTLGIPPLSTLHDWTVGLLKSGATYDLSYRAAFVYPTRERLPLISGPALICAGPADMLIEGLELARNIAPAATEVVATPATVWYPGQPPDAVAATIAIYDRFLREA